MEAHACVLGTYEAKAEDCLELETRLDKQQEHQKNKNTKRGGVVGMEDMIRPDCKFQMLNLVFSWDTT